MVSDDRRKRRIKEMEKIKRDGTSTEYDLGKIQGKKEVFDDIENNCNLWTTGDIESSSNISFNDQWLSMTIVNKLKKKHLTNNSNKEKEVRKG